MKHIQIAVALGCMCLLGTVLPVRAQKGAAGVQSQIAAEAAAAQGAAAAVSKGQGDLMRGQAMQEQELRMRAENAEKAKAATAKLPTPKTAVSAGVPSVRPVARGDWAFGKVTALNGVTGKPDDSPTAAAAMKVLKSVRGKDPADLLAKAKKEMQLRGYYLYTDIKDTVKEHADSKTVDVTVDFGHVRSLTIAFADHNRAAGQGVSWKPDGRFFSGAQIRKRYMRDLDANSVFNYQTLYERFYQLNAHPDLRGNLKIYAVDADGNSVTNTGAQRANADIRQLALRLDMEEEKLPLHFVFDVDNNGTDASENWMGRATAQYLNLTKHDDVLTLNYQNSLTDIEALGGFAGSYYLPHTFGTRRDFAFTLYGGWTDVDSKDVVDGIDVEGQGWFVGVQESATLLENPRHLLKLSVGAVRRYVEDNLVVQDQKLEGNDITVMPFTFSLMYSDKQTDALKGMNFATVELLANFGDFMGTADEEEMKAQRMAAEKDYVVLHFQVARLQMIPVLSLAGTNAYGNPMLFARVNGQVADGALIPAEQFGLGGDGSVRGYATREYLGDHGVSGTLEFRLPIVLGLFDRSTGLRDAPWDRLQGVAFVDAGYVKIEDPLPGEEESKTLCGAGLGLRMALTDHFQVKCDLAFPLEETEDSDSMCVHFSAQVQF